MWPGHVVDRFNVTVNQGRLSRARCFVGSVFLHYQTIWDRCADGPREFDQSAHVWRLTIPVWRFTLRRLSQGQFAVVPVTCSLFEHPALWPHICMKINCRSEESRAYTNTFTLKCLFCCLALKVWCVLCFSPARPQRRLSPALMSRLLSKRWPKLPPEPLDRATASLHLRPKAGILGTLQVRCSLDLLCVYSLKRFSHSKHSVIVYMLFKGKRILSINKYFYYLKK